MKQKRCLSQNYSSFICLRCMNTGLSGIYRNQQREKYHVKDLFCFSCFMNTKHIEIRGCDFKCDILQKAPEIRKRYYADEAADEISFLEG